MIETKISILYYFFSGNVSYDSSSGRVKLSTDPVKKIVNAIMELEPAKMSDRGEVSCKAHNAATTIQDPMEAKIYVRVKGTANFYKSCPTGRDNGDSSQSASDSSLPVKRMAH